MLPSMLPNSRKARLTAKLAIATSAMTLLLLVAGGLVWSTGSALACPDWPLCYGEFFPPMRGQVLFEHGHRLIAASVATLTVVLAVRTFSDSRLRPLSLLALGLVLVQALLGGLTVLLRLPLLVRVLHLATSQACFAAILVLTARVIQLGSEGGSGTPKALATLSSGASRALGFAAAAVYLQLLLGALVRHTGSAMACQSALLCDGRLWPAGFGPGEVQMLHRLWALCTGALVIWSTVRALPELKRSTSPFPRALAVGAHGLLLTQIALGVSSVLSFLEVPIVTAHLAVGALLWGDILLLWILTRAPGAATARDELERFGQELARS
jgi:heme A synthase